METWIAEAKSRLDVFLAAQAPISRMQAGKLIRARAVKVNGRLATKPAHILEAGDAVEASLDGVPASETHLTSADLHFSILYEDDACLVLNKPAGLSVHPAMGIPRTTSTVLHGIAHLFAERKLPFDAAHVLVHRLDKDTTGCLLVAKTAEAHRLLQEQFATRTVQKSYLALVSGIPDPPAAIIDAAIGRSTMDRTKMSVLGGAKTREAKTTYRTLERAPNAALLQCTLHTGRTHQIRVHLRAIGHPILGDPAYSTTTSDSLSAERGISSVCLHAWKVSFVSPVDSKEHAVTAPLPTLFLDAMEMLGMERKNYRDEKDAEE